jgi:hypothetical protein
LRTDYIKPISNLTITAPPLGGAILTWTLSPDPAVIGYYVYRADSVYGYYQRLNTTMLTSTTTTYHDLTSTAGLKHYMVRPVKLQSTPSGGYYNLGIGNTDTVTIAVSVLSTAAIQPSLDVSIFPNPVQDRLNVTLNASSSCVVSMYVVNEEGQTTNRATKQLNAGNNTYSLNTSSMTPGMYSIVVNTGSGQVVKKWIKL